MNNTYGDRLQEFLDEQNLKVADFANSLGVHRSVVYGWLKNHSYPTLDKLITIADMFSCSIEYLLGYIDVDNEHVFKKCERFGDRIRKLMKERKVSKYRLIKDKVCNPGNFTDWQKRHSQPTLASLNKLAEFFKMSIDELVGRI